MIGLAQQCKTSLRVLTINDTGLQLQGYEAGQVEHVQAVQIK